MARIDGPRVEGEDGGKDWPGGTLPPWLSIRLRCGWMIQGTKTQGVFVPFPVWLRARQTPPIVNAQRRLPLSLIQLLLGLCSLVE